MPNLSTADYHSLMSSPCLCVSPAFCLAAAPLQNSPSPPQLCARLQQPADHRCAVNWETHTSVIKAVGGLVLYQLPPIPLLWSPPSPSNSTLSAQLIIVPGPDLPPAVLSLSNDAFSERQGLCPTSAGASWGQSLSSGQPHSI